MVPPLAQAHRADLVQQQGQASVPFRDRVLQGQPRHSAGHSVQVLDQGMAIAEGCPQRFVQVPQENEEIFECQCAGFQVVRDHDLPVVR